MQCYINRASLCFTLLMNPHWPLLYPLISFPFFRPTLCFELPPPFPPLHIKIGLFVTKQMGTRFVQPDQFGSAPLASFAAKWKFRMKVKSTARTSSDLYRPCVTLNICSPCWRNSNETLSVTHENGPSPSSHSHFYSASPTCLNAVFLCYANQVCMALTGMLLLKCFSGPHT